MNIASRLKDKGFNVAASLEILLLLLIMTATAIAEDGYRLWLRYEKIPEQRAAAYRARIKSVIAGGNSETLAAARDELKTGIDGLLGVEIRTAEKNIVDGTILVGTPKTSAIIDGLLSDRLAALGDEGFIIRSIKGAGKNITLIASNTETGALYGAFHFLRLIQTLQPIDNLNISEKPRLQIRMLDHWDNLDGSIERGYAGKSLWSWAELPGKIDSRLRDYARRRFNRNQRRGFKQRQRRRALFNARISEKSRRRSRRISPVRNKSLSFRTLFRAGRAWRAENRRPVRRERQKLVEKKG